MTARAEGQPEIRAGLAASWESLAEEIAGVAGGASIDAAAWATVGSRLIDAYGEPDRRYHGLGHLASVLDAVGLLEQAADDATAVRLGAWFHDAVYDPRAGDNEEASAQLTEAWLRPVGVSAKTVTEAARLVRLTRTHAPAPDDRNGAVLCDADLSILASDSDRYASYVAEVRAEYAHVPDADFNRGRARVLEQLMSHPRLFATERGLQWWERKARDNVNRELEALRGRSVD